MSDASEVELARDEAPFAPPPAPRSPVPWIAILIALVFAIGLGWYFFGRGDPAAPASTTFSEGAVAPDATRPLGTDPGIVIELPPLAGSDPFVRELIGELSSHPRVMAWLATNGLIRSFTVAVQNIADGRVPSQSLRPLGPGGRFTVIEGGTDLRIDPRSYARYNGLADAIGSVDPAGAAQYYTTLKPRIQEAYDELGENLPFDFTLERALVLLLRTPVLDGDVRLDPKGGVFAFEDPRIERLTAAQKQLARMGPRNARMIKDKLRAIAVALGIPNERLPAS